MVSGVSQLLYLLVILTFLPHIVTTGGADTALKLTSYTFKTNSAWQKKLEQGVQKVSWQYLVWFKKFIPKHSFFSWLVFLNRLSIRDRQLRHNPLADDKCVPCGGLESRNHFVFLRPYSLTILSAVMTKI